MNIRTPQLPQLDLSKSKYEKPFFVDMESFFEFSFWIAEELLELESRYGANATPKQAVASQSIHTPAKPVNRTENGKVAPK